MYTFSYASKDSDETVDIKITAWDVTFTDLLETFWRFTQACGFYPPYTLEQLDEALNDLYEKENEEEEEYNGN